MYHGEGSVNINEDYPVSLTGEETETQGGRSDWSRTAQQYQIS